MSSCQGGFCVSSRFKNIYLFISWAGISFNIQPRWDLSQNVRNGFTGACPHYRTMAQCMVTYPFHRVLQSPYRTSSASRNVTSRSATFERYRDCYLVHLFRRPFHVRTFIHQQKFLLFEVGGFHETLANLPLAWYCCTAMMHTICNLIATRLMAHSFGSKISEETVAHWLCALQPTLM